MELRQGDRVVAAGVLAEAGTNGLRLLSPADAWLRELLMQGETGPWDAVDFSRGVALGAEGDWRMDQRGAPAGRRIWKYAAGTKGSAVLFDQYRWQRGVIVGRVMLLPEGPLPNALAVPPEAAPAVQRVLSESYSQPNGAVCAVLFAPSGSGGIVTREMTIACSARGCLVSIPDLFRHEHIYCGGGGLKLVGRVERRDSGGEGQSENSDTGLGVACRQALWYGSGRARWCPGSLGGDQAGAAWRGFSTAAQGRLARRSAARATKCWS